ncbi:hypothetical protein GGR51DRAFT_562852 [Nemania sp. FL0031]|nr:hypothetical protein GGR51DRAFT_562852 [Nemania sp. FL0031]
MADPEFVILKYIEWMNTADFESIILGSVVKNFLHPTACGLPRGVPPITYSHKLKTVDKSFNDFVRGLTGFSFAGAFQINFSLKDKILRYKRLQQVPEFFENLTDDPEVKYQVPS